VNTTFEPKGLLLDVRPGHGKFRTAVQFALASLVFGLLLTASVVWWQNDSLQQQNQARFELGAQRTESEVLRRLDHVVLGLKAARNAISAHEQLSRQEFRDYVSRDLETEYPGVRGFGFVQRVLRPDLPGFVARARAANEPDFAVRSSGTFADLYVVRFIEPLARNRAALGLDVGQERRRRAAIETTINSGEATLSEHLELVQDSQQSPGFLYFLPVYKKGSDPQTPAQRQRDLFGVVVAPVVASELLGSVYQSSEQQIDFELYDGLEGLPSNLVFDADGVSSLDRPAARGQARDNRRFALERGLVVGGHVLMLRLSGNARFEAALDRSSLAIVAAGGQLFDGAVGGLAGRRSPACAGPGGGHDNRAAAHGAGGAAYRQCGDHHRPRFAHPVGEPGLLPHHRLQPGRGAGPHAGRVAGIRQVRPGGTAGAGRCQRARRGLPGGADQPGQGRTRILGRYRGAAHLRPGRCAVRLHGNRHRHQQPAADPAAA
jgi:CHASE1-domain containing sensor protein